MKGNIVLGTLFSAALAVSVAAQGTATGTQADQQSSKNQAQRNQVTVTGCLQNADMAGGTAGTTGTGATGATGAQKSGSARSEQFMLTNARITSGGTAGTTGAGTGTGAGATSTSPADNRFILTGGNQSELKKYLNSEVEIRGTLQPRSDRGAAAGTGTGTGTGTGAATSSAQKDERANAQMLRVTSVKQTSPTCTGGN
jgi:hypothetical protein